MTGAGWGRWGANDERGALNLVDSQAVRRGLDAARRGQVLPLGLPVQSRQVPVVPPRPPVLHTMLVDGADFEAGARRGPNGFQVADDHLSLACHSGTHIDALSHVARDGLMYNGIPASEVRSTTGARRLGIDRVGGIVCRGVLIDVLGAANGRLDPGRPIRVADLERALNRMAVQLQPGDAVLVRTGWLARFDPGDPNRRKVGIDRRASDIDDPRAGPIKMHQNHGIDYRQRIAVCLQPRLFEKAQRTRSRVSAGIGREFHPLQPEINPFSMMLSDSDGRPVHTGLGIQRAVRDAGAGTASTSSCCGRNPRTGSGNGIIGIGWDVQAPGRCATQVLPKHAVVVKPSSAGGAVV